MRKIKLLLMVFMIGIFSFAIDVKAGVTEGVTEEHGVKVNTTVVDHYVDIDITDDIILEKDKEYIIDFTKEDNLSKALSAMADLEGTVYYKITLNNGKASLDKSDNDSEATIKIVSNKEENKAVMSVLNLDENKSYNLDFSYKKIIDSKLTYNSTDYESGKILVGDLDAIRDAYKEKGSVVINETRDDYYSRYNFKCKLNLIVTPIKETTNYIESSTDINGSITFEKEVSKNYTLDIKKVEVKKELADKNVKYLVDINILENGEVVKIDNIKMQIRIALPEELKEYKNYEVVYISNDEIKETIPATIEDGYIVFETTHLSEYGIVATEKINNTENPKTGDNIFLYLTIIILSIIGLTGVSTIAYKKNKLF